MKKLLLSLSLIPHFLSGALPSSSISSGKASYDGNILVLKEKVQLEHALGKMESGAARLEKEGKSDQFSSINLRDDVLISLKSRGKISCASADFDFTKMKGILLPAAGKLIHFQNLHSDLFSLTSERADVELGKESEGLQIMKVNAGGDVHIQYGEDFFLNADNATYLNETVPHLYATPNCTLTHFEDEIHAEKIDLFPESAKVILSSPQGHIKASGFSNGAGLAFSCNRMLWERTPQILTLQGDISIEDAGIGSIRCEEEIELRQKLQNEKWELRTITARGKTKLDYKLDDTPGHTLLCNGLMQLDQARLVLTAKSTHEQPIEYFHEKMQLVADQAQLDYTELQSPKGNQKIEPKQLVLSGSVRLSSIENSLRCALADQFTYDLEQDRMILSVSNGNNVLFWDEEQGLSVSAREVHIKPGEKGGNIKGVGNVRFTFSSTENDMLKKTFPFYRTKGNTP